MPYSRQSRFPVHRSFNHRSFPGRPWLLGGVVSLLTSVAYAQTPGTARLSIAPNEIASPVSPMLYGMMTEEINHAFDGGLYAEMVQNRTFRTTWEGI